MRKTIPFLLASVWIAGCGVSNYSPAGSVLLPGKEDSSISSLPDRSWPSFDGIYESRQYYEHDVEAVERWQIEWRDDGTWKQEVVYSETLGIDGIELQHPAGYWMEWNGSTLSTYHPYSGEVSRSDFSNIESGIAPNHWLQHGYFTSHDEFDELERDRFSVVHHEDGSATVRKDGTAEPDEAEVESSARGEVGVVDEWRLRDDLLIESYSYTEGSETIFDVTFLDIMVVD